MNAVKRNSLLATFAVGCALLAAILLFFLLAYGQLKIADDAQTKKDDDVARVVVAVEPCAYLVERVGGDRVRVVALAPKGKSPEEYAPSPSQIAPLADSDLFFTVGMPIERRFVESAASLSKDMKIAPLQDLDDEDQTIDPHPWTSPALARSMVAKIKDALAELDPQNEPLFAANAAALDDELQRLQREIAEKLAPFQGKFFLTCHPAYGQFAKEFHLEQLAVERDGKAPKPRELEELIQRAKDANVKTALLQPEFNRASAQALANQIGLKLVEHSPLEKDYFANLRALADAVAESFDEDAERVHDSE